MLPSPKPQEPSRLEIEALRGLLVRSVSLQEWDLKMRTIALVIILTILSGGMSNVLAAQLQTTVEATAWKDVAAAIPLGSRVKAQTVEGKRISGTLMRVGDGALLVKKNTRLPEPAVSIAFTDVSKLERDHSGNLNVAKAIGIGLASGAGVLLTLFAIALQFD